MRPRQRSIHADCRTRSVPWRAYAHAAIANFRDSRPRTRISHIWGRTRSYSTSLATLTIMRGLPASGKSTWARKHVADHPDTVIVSLDGLRRMMMGSLTDYRSSSARLRLHSSSMPREQVNATIFTSASQLAANCTSSRTRSMVAFCASMMTFR